MTATGPGGVSNQITGGVFFHAVIQGRDIQVVLPAEVRPALTGLPPASAVFTGRDSTVRALWEALRPDQPGGVQLVSAVSGMAGIGKTELVLHTAHQALREGWFPGGVLFVDMFGYDLQRRLSAGDALVGWLSAIGIPGEHIPAAEQDRSRLWRSVLDAYTTQGRRLLLIIDNAAGEDQVGPLLPGDDRVAVLVTSRHTLDLDARLHDLDVLDPAAALTLISEVIAGRRGPDDPRLHQDGQAAIAGLAELCAGLPLALRIVAALLADRPHLQADALAGRLRDDQHRLDGLSRQQAAVRAAFDLSYQHLPPAQARLFQLLPVNPGPDIATTTVAHLAGLAQHQAAVLLEDLHRAHLIAEPAPDRWGMHDLLRLYAAQKQPSGGGQETDTGQARQRLYRYYQDTTRTANTHLNPNTPADTSVFTDRPHALAWLDAEHTNLTATATTAPTHHLAEVTCDLAFTLAEFLDFRRHFTDWITITTLARDIFQQTGDLHGEGEAWGSLGLALAGVRRFEEAIEAHTRARDIFQQTGDLHGEGRAWGNLGLALAGVRRFEEAIEAHTRARDIFQQTGDLHGEGRAWNNLGLALAEVRRFDEAIEAHTKDLKICQQTGDLHGEGTARGNLGLALAGVRRFDEAIEAHTRARDIFQQTGDLRGEGRAWNNLGLAQRQVHRFDEAIEAHTKDLKICQQTGDLHGEGTAWNNLGLAQRRVRRFEEAITAHTRARDIFQQTGDLHGEGRAWGSLGLALAGVRRFDEAIEAHTRARDICQQTDDLHGEGTAWNNLGLAQRQVRRFEEAITAHTRARDIFQQTGDLHGEGQAWGSLGLALVEVRRFDEARTSWQRAVTAFTSTGDTDSATVVRGWLDDLPPTDSTS
ncbi:tetratricopeptide repeat protein [Verrucosispora sp. WMMA2121]|uniref:ATP-binding protein n=1 Tax=Verrucosispora sp. WMMA2121 TaxID=3015164 RepID=UPI0022B6CCE8|nr:tetratricopeptide repeat protein [Verrucosispora sp. WMMA2121]MCZ7421923.1 tetratricopeptide repeat protein [Verrucosispora sp. WMMA2121]